MIVLCSGGFDPVHSGHLRYLESAAELGDVIVAVNSDEWVKNKKGYVFHKWDERAQIVKALKPVHDIISVNDIDGTVCSALRHIKPDIFANGGDRTIANPKEHSICKELNIKEIFNVGGSKTNSSSELITNVIRSHHDNNQNTL